MKKTFNIICFIVVVIILGVFIFIFNKKVDPYSLEIMEYKRDVSDYDRDFLYTFINLTAKYKYDYIYMCASCGNSSMVPYIFEEYTKKKIFMINTPGISPFEQYNLLKHFLELHPETKTIIISLEFNTYVNCYSKYTLPKNPTNKLYDIFRVYFSISSVMDSFEKLKNRIMEKEGEPIEEGPQFHYNRKIKYYYWEFCEFDNLAILKKINNLAKEYKINTIYFIPPTNALYLSHIYKKDNYYKHFENYKRGIADIVSYYDMAFVNEYTKKPVRLYFADVMHPNPDIFTVKVVDCLIYHKCNSNLVQYVTKDNAEEVLKSQRQLIINYINNNKSYVEEYINFDDNVEKQKETEEILYIDKLPSAEKKLLYKP